MAITGSAASIAPQVSAASAISKVPQAILLAVAQAESSFNPSAVHINSNGTQDYGLFQLNTGTFGSSVYTMTPQQQANAAANLLAQNYAKTGDWGQALSMYNSGSPTGAQDYATNVLGLANQYAAQTGEQLGLPNSIGSGASAGSAATPTPSNVPIVGPVIDWAAANLVPIAVGVSTRTTSA